MTMGDRAIPVDLLRKAQCVAIVPGLKKGAFVVGAKFGRGFVSCRTASGWSAPAGIRMEGGSVGFQIGGTEIDVILAIMNKRGVERLLSNKFTLGADASVAAGPLGRTAAAQTDAAMTAEILSWSRSRGVFAGVALEGATLRGDDDANLDLYGKRLEMRAIVTGSTPVPPAAQPLISRLSKY
jgi:lipid-binding SYLF domain-containing protein